MSLVAEFAIDPAHPALPGHFPGAPVVPGVLLLEHVIAAAERTSSHAFAVRGLRVARFLAPLLPGQAATARIELRSERLDFEVLVDARRIANGSFVVERAVQR